jgi:hypothetical protein
MRPRQEWDWPPEGNSRERYVDAVPRRTGWAMNRITSGYLRVLLFLLKVVAGAFCGLAFVGCLLVIKGLISAY